METGRIIEDPAEYEKPDRQIKLLIGANEKYKRAVEQRVGSDIHLYFGIMSSAENVLRHKFEFTDEQIMKIKNG